MGDNLKRFGLCIQPNKRKQIAPPPPARKNVPLRRKDEPIFEMPPLPSMDSFKNDPWMEHPLLHYKALREKKRQDDEVVIRRGKKVKNFVADGVYKKKQAAPEEDKTAELEQFLTQDDFAEYRRDSVKAAPVVPLSKAGLMRITQMLTKALKRNHPELFRALAKEVKERYEAVLHETILNFVLIPPPDYVNPYELEVKYPMFSTGPPPWRDSYRVNRRMIAQNLRILYPIVCKAFLKLRELMKLNKLFYPEKIKGHGLNYMRPTELKDIIIQQIRSNGDIFLQKLTPQLVKIFQNPSALKSVSNDMKLDKIMECISHMINLNATTWAIDTIREIVQTYENYETLLPRILVDTAVEDGKIVYAPPMEGWMYCFKKMMDEIVSVVQNIPDASELFWTRSDADKSISVYCKITLPSFFVDEMTERFYNVMTDWLSHAQKVSDRIFEQYKILLDGSCRAKLQAFVASEGHQFYEAFKESAILKKLTESMYSIPKNEFGGWLQVNNEDVIGRLLDSCKSHQNIISDHLSNWMRDHNYSIINGYKEMRDHLLKKPATTAELMELIEYIDEARGVLLLLLKEDIIEGLKMNLAYMDYYLLGADDMELTVTAHKMLRKIQPAFEKCAIMIEDQKVYFEEQLNEKIAEMKIDLNKLLRRIRDDFGRYGDYSQVTQYCEDSRYVLKRVAELQKGVDWINNEEVLFKFNQTQFEDMNEIMYNLEPYSRLFQVAAKWQRAEKKYMDGDFDLDADAIDEETAAYEKELLELQTLFKSRIKEDKEREAKEKHIPVSMLYDEDNLDEIPPPLKLCNITLESLTKFRANGEVMQVLCNPHLRKRHWVQMSDLSSLEMVPDTGSSLRKLLNMEIDPHMNQFEDVSFTATQEFILAETIGKMKEAWLSTKIDSVPYKDTDTNILFNADETQYLLKRQIYDTQILKGSRFAKPHQDIVGEWEEDLLRAQSTMDEWLKVQSKWMYLEHMFTSEDIQAIMPAEGHLFTQADESWRNIIADLEFQENALEMAKKPGLLEKMEQCNKLLEKVTKGLNDYLEEKRIFFSRLFFLTNEEMVEILSETKDPNQIQPFLVKLFEGISELRIDSELLAFGMLSSEGERVTFTNPVDTAGVKGCVEKWLSQVEESMVETMKNITTYSKDAYMHTSRVDWMTKWPGQVVLCVSQIYWTSEVHKAFLRSTAGIQNYLAKWNTHLDNTVALVRGELPKLQRAIFGALVTVDVHSRDILEEMVNNKVEEDTDFFWVSQLRHYYEDAQVVIRAVNSHIGYGYEYLGNPARLILTPPSDRCIRSLIGAYHLNLNASVIGNSGKTETVKHLAKTIAKQCFVFGCSEELDIFTLGRLIKGFASSGAWLCLDDFNKMDPCVMSVIVPQLWTIHQSVAAKMETVMLDGTELPLNLSCFCIITMNPYIGQSSLPENLKLLFRPVALMVPDFEVIRDINFFSKGI